MVGGSLIKRQMPKPSRTIKINKMSLTVTEINQILKSPKAKEKKVEIKNHEEKIRFHTCTEPSTSSVNEFLRWVKPLIDRSKFSVFNHLLREPFPSVSLVDEINETLKKVFEGIDPSFTYEFINEDYEKDGKDYIKGVCDFNFFRNESWSVMKEAINSVMIVDMPQEQNTPLPMPYFYFMRADYLFDFGENGGNIEYVMFHPDDDKTLMNVYDDKYYRQFNLNDKMQIDGIVIESEHGLGRCPAAFFWTDFLSNEKKYLKKSPISNKISDLDWLLFYANSKRHLELYASYPIYWGFTQDCDYIEGDVECHDGYLRYTDTKNYLWNNTELAECPKCKRAKLAGAGSYYEVDPPGDYNDGANLREPIGIVKVDHRSLEFNVSEVDNIASKIYSSVVGSAFDAVDKMSINEMQVMSLFESRKAVLQSLKLNFEKAQKWATDTICKLRYGDYYVSCTINYGSDWFLATENELLNIYEKGKKEQFSPVVLDYLEDLYYKTKFKDKQDQYDRIKMLNALLPVRHATKSDVIEMYKNNVITYDNFYLQMNFSKIINKFELEYGNILVFNIGGSFDERVKIISDILKNYIEDELKRKASQAERTQEGVGSGQG